LVGFKKKASKEKEPRERQEKTPIGRGGIVIPELKRNATNLGKCQEEKNKFQREGEGVTFAKKTSRCERRHKFLRGGEKKGKVGGGSGELKGLEGGASIKQINSGKICARPKNLVQTQGAKKPGGSKRRAPND